MYVTTGALNVGEFFSRFLTVINGMSRYAFYNTSTTLVVFRIYYLKYTCVLFILLSLRNIIRCI